MKIVYNQNYELDVQVVKVPEKDLYQLKLTRLDPMEPKYYSRQEYFFEPHQLKQLASFLSEAADGIK